MTAHLRPALSVIVPTYNNEAVLRDCLTAWMRCAPRAAVELIVIADGCTDGTTRTLEKVAATPWGQRHMRWLPMDDAHELRCTNAGFAASRAPLVMAWQDDMFIRASWLVPEIIATFGRHSEIGLLSLSRGLNHRPSAAPLDSWDALNDWSRLESTIGPSGWNWFRIQEVDTVIRPWVVRRACLDRVGHLDEAFVPTEWDEADLAFRIRQAGWNVATCGYERLGAYRHLGSSTIGPLSEAYRAGVLKNGQLFHDRWDAAIASDHRRTRRSWPRVQTAGAWMSTCRAIVTRGLRRSIGAW